MGAQKRPQKIIPLEQGLKQNGVQGIIDLMQIASEDHSIRTRIETLFPLTTERNNQNPQKIIPLEQGLKQNEMYEAYRMKKPASEDHSIRTRIET